MDDFLQVILEESENAVKPPSLTSDAILGSSEDHNNGVGVIFAPTNPLVINSDYMYSCKYCQERFTCKADQSTHLQLCHADERPFRCPHCEKRFTTKNILKQHERVHTKERPYTCQHCHKTFSHRTALANHIRTHTGEKPYSCLYCEKSFGEKAKLLLHMRVHTGEKPFVCEHCQRAFRDKSSYNVHLRIHTGEKPFMCSFCQRCFTHRNSFKDHLRVHTGERPYMCVHCKRDFAKQSTLRKHLEVHGVVKPFDLNVHAIIKPCNNNNPVRMNNRLKVPVVSNNYIPNVMESEDPLLQCPDFDAVDHETNVDRENGTGLDAQLTNLPSDPNEPFNCCPVTAMLSYMPWTSYVCYYCNKSFNNMRTLENHSRKHNAESKAWKMGMDMMFLFMSILGMDTASEAGLMELSPLDLLQNFLTAVGVTPRMNYEGCAPDVFLQLLLKIFMAIIADQDDREIINFDKVNILDLLQDMILLYPLCRTSA